MNQFEKQLYEEMGGSNSFDVPAGSAGSSNLALGATLQKMQGNPDFKAEISLNFIVKYYSQAVVGTPVEVASAAIPAGQKTKLPVYIFGHNDLAAGFKAGKDTVQAAGWNLTDSAVYFGNGLTAPQYNPLPHAAAQVGYALGSVFNNVVKNGDLVLAIPMNGFVAGAAATTVTAEVIITCPNVPYLSLIQSLASDIFVINMIRYTVDTTLTSQLQNQLALVYQSVFGKTSKDTIDPNTYIAPNTFNRNISDIPMELIINKYIEIAMPINFDCVSFSWTLTIAKINKFGQ